MTGRAWPGRKDQYEIMTGASGSMRLVRSYLTIIPRARMGFESIAHEAEGHKGERNNCFSKIKLVGQKYRE